MAYRGDWLPSSRDGRLGMAKNWETMIEKNNAVWKVADELVTKLSECVTAFEPLHNTPAAQRTPAVNASIKTAEAELAAVMRDIKKRYFFEPPLTETDVVGLGLKPKDTIITPVGEPKGHAVIEISRGGMMQLKLNIKSTDHSDERADYGCRIYYSVLPRTEVSAEKSPSGIRYLKKPPTSGDDLIDSIFTRKKRELFDFHPDDKGNMIYFCARYENSKGQKGPWGPVSSEMIG